MSSLVIFFILIIYTFFYVRNSYLKRDLKIFDYFLIWFTLIYAIVPLFYLYDKTGFMHQIYLKVIFEKNFFYESLIVLISFIFCVIGYKTYHNKGYTIITNIQSNNSLYKISIILFILSVLSYVYFLSRYGGINYLLNNVSDIRSGTDENKDYLGAFVKMFSNFLTYAFVIQLFLYYKNFFKGKYFASFLFGVLFLLLISRALLDGGRAGIIIIFIYILLSMEYLKGKINKSFLLIAIFGGLFVVFFGKTFLFAFFSSEFDLNFNEVRASQESKGYLNLFVHEFNHQFLSLSNFVRNEFEFRYFKDYIIWLFKPLKLIGGGNFYDSISYYNTYIIMGDWNSNIPPGFVAFGYINGGIVGLILQSFVTGRILCVIDKTFKNSNFKNNGLLFFIYLYLFNYVWFGLQNGDIALIIQSGFVFFVLIGYFLFTKKIVMYKIKN